MKMQIFIEGERGEILIDRSYGIMNEKAPNIYLQDLIDDAIEYQKDSDLRMEANQLVVNND